MKKRITMLMIAIIFIILIVIAFTFFMNHHNTNYITVGDETYKEANYLEIEKEKFPELDYENIHYTNKRKGKDTNGDEYIILEYSPEQLNEDVAYEFVNKLLNYDEYYELKDGNFTNEFQMISRASNAEKTLVVSVHCDDESAYIKYSVCKTSSLNLESSLLDYDEFISEE